MCSPSKTSPSPSSYDLVIYLKFFGGVISDGEGNGNPWTEEPGITKSQTRLSDFTLYFIIWEVCTQLKFFPDDI